MAALPKPPGRWISAGHGWHYQHVRLGRGLEGCALGYVKIRNPQGVVVDRALTATVARRRIKKLKEG